MGLDSVDSTDPYSKKTRLLLMPAFDCQTVKLERWR